LWEAAHIVNKYQPIPNNPRIALITASTTECLPKIDQAKSAKAQSENTSTMLLVLGLLECCTFLSFMYKDYAPTQLTRTGVSTSLRFSFALLNIDLGYAIKCCYLLPDNRSS
jgi:hypothetical protein